MNNDKKLGNDKAHRGGLRRLRRVAASCTLIGGLIGTTGAITGGAVAVSTQTGCTPQAKQAVISALNDVQQACVWANANLPLPVIKETCTLVDVADELVLLVIDDFFAHQATIARYVARYDSAKLHNDPFPSLTAKRAEPAVVK